MQDLILHHGPTNTDLVINSLYADDDIIFVENHFECECPAGYIHDKSKTQKCPDCGATSDESPDARLNDWCVQNSIGALDYGMDGLLEFVKSDDVTKVESTCELIDCPH